MCILIYIYITIYVYIYIHYICVYTYNIVTLSNKCFLKIQYMYENININGSSIIKVLLV